MKNAFYALFLLMFLSNACKTAQTMGKNNIQVHAIRLKPGQDLKAELEQFAKKNDLKAAWLVTCAGSLTHYNMRFANQPNGSTGEGHFEIVSLTGTLSTNGSHIHLSISDSTGRTIGGHLLAGCTIYTTAEIVIQSSSNLIFKREKDGTTPWEELQIEKLNP